MPPGVDGQDDDHRGRVRADRQRQAALSKMCPCAGNLAEMAWPRRRLDDVPQRRRAGQRREPASRHRHLVGQRRIVVLAECLGGTEQAFATQMNALAKRLGMNEQPLLQCERLARRGLHRGHRARPRRRWPARRSSGIPSSTSNSTGSRSSPGARPWGRRQDITQANRNPILGAIAGADGLEDRAHGRGRLRLHRLGRAERPPPDHGVAGLGSFNQRIEESRKLMNWGFNAWQSKPLYAANAAVGSASGPARRRERGCDWSRRAPSRSPIRRARSAASPKCGSPTTAR